MVKTINIKVVSRHNGAETRIIVIDPYESVYPSPGRASDFVTPYGADRFEYEFASIMHAGMLIEEMDREALKEKVSSEGWYLCSPNYVISTIKRYIDIAETRRSLGDALHNFDPKLTASLCQKIAIYPTEMLEMILMWIDLVEEHEIDRARVLINLIVGGSCVPRKEFGNKYMDAADRYGSAKFYKEAVLQSADLSRGIRICCRYQWHNLLEATLAYGKKINWPFNLEIAHKIAVQRRDVKLQIILDQYRAGAPYRTESSFSESGVGLNGWKEQHNSRQERSSSALEFLSSFVALQIKDFFEREIGEELVLQLGARPSSFSIPDRVWRLRLNDGTLTQDQWKRYDELVYKLNSERQKYIEDQAAIYSQLSLQALEDLWGNRDSLDTDEVYALRMAVRRAKGITVYPWVSDRTW